MRVLVGCEFSATVRDAFRRRGHDAWSCDLLPCEGDPQYHYQQDVLEVIDQEQWDLAIFHPPCTYLAVSGLHWNARDPARRKQTEEALEFVSALLTAPIERIALENPVGCISTRIRKPDQIIQPYEFGHDASKKTCLWLKNLPPLTPTQYIHPRYVCKDCGKTMRGYAGACSRCGGERVGERWANQTDSNQNRLGPSPDRWKLRSLTYQGIADAMADQWG